VKPLDPLDQPFLPVLGDLYWVSTVILWSGDKKPTRPVVVIEVPSDLFGRIALVTRTSDTTRKGVAHDPMPEIGLAKPGVFADYASTEAILWTPRNVQRLGALPAPVLANVLDRFR
jgi:hypothetical protein